MDKQKTYLLYAEKVIPLEKGNKTVIFDFVKEAEAKEYVSFLDKKLDKVASYYIQITFSAKVKITENCYYEIKEELLRSHEGLPDNGIFLCQLNLITQNDVQEQIMHKPPCKPEDKLGELFSNKSNCKYLKLDNQQDYRYLSKLISTDDDGSLKVQVKINDVGQGNWNELYINDQLFIVYDIGTQVFIKKNDAREMIKSHIHISHIYKHVPFLIISHWDFDHYNILLSMTDDELKSFNCIIAPDNIKSCTPSKIIQRFCDLGSSEVCLVKSKEWNINKNRVNLVARGYNVTDFIKLYIGTNSRNKNLSGIILSIRKENQIALFTGDCSYEQINEILKIETRDDKLDKLYIIIPHHGGGSIKNLQIRKFFSLITVPIKFDSVAIISVCEFEHQNGNVIFYPNNYHHPRKEIISFFYKNKFTIRRTDTEKEDIELDISLKKGLC